MRGSKQELPVTTEVPQATVRQVEWGGMSVGLADIHQPIDIGPLLKGLPDDRCQCPHWGYVLKGQMRFQYADHEEVFSEGDVYYVEPGHSMVVEEGCEYVEFSPADQLIKTTEVVERNLKALQ